MGFHRIYFTNSRIQNSFQIAKKKPQSASFRGGMGLLLASAAVNTYETLSLLDYALGFISDKTEGEIPAAYSSSSL